MPHSLLDFSSSRRPKLQAAFSVDIQDYALPQDLIYQDEITQHLAQVFDSLSRGPLHNRGLGQEILVQGRTSSDRLKTPWTAQRNQSTGAEKLSYMVEGSNKNLRPALAAPSTRPGKTHPVGVSQTKPDMGFSTIAHFTGKIHELGYYTHGHQKEANRFSAQEQFEILHGQGNLHDDAMREFHKVRLNERIVHHPFPNEKGVADAAGDREMFEVHVSLLSGDSASVFVHQERSRQRIFTVAMDLPARQLDLNIALEKGAPTIGRNSVHETRFTTLEALDDLLPKAVQMVTRFGLTGSSRYSVLPLLAFLLY